MALVQWYMIRKSSEREAYGLVSPLGMGRWAPVRVLGDRIGRRIYVFTAILYHQLLHYLSMVAEISDRQHGPHPYDKAALG